MGVDHRTVWSQNDPNFKIIVLIKCRACIHPCACVIWGPAFRCQLKAS